MQNTRLLVAEDDASLVELLRYRFESEKFEVTDTPSGAGALRLAQETAPDVVLLDWMLEDLSGLEVCRRLRGQRETRNIPVIMLTARDEEADRVRGLAAGADDYVTKPFSPRELVARVRAVLRRTRPAPAEEKLVFCDLEMDLVSHRVARSGHRIHLGPTEYRLLRYFLEHPRRVVSRDRIISAVWAHDQEVGARTVDVLIQRLRHALNKSGAPNLIRTVRAAGYSLDLEG